jgi:hypothetical protein
MLEIAEKLSDTALANQPLTALLISSLLFFFIVSYLFILYY